MSPEKVISRKVLGSANPFAKKFRDIKGAISGVGCGLPTLIVGLGLIFFSVFGVTEYSKIVASLTLINAKQASEESGLVKIQGKAISTTPLVYTYKDCNTYTGCNSPGNTLSTLENVLYYDATLERYEVVKETTTKTRTVVENGQEIEETYEDTTFVEKWVEKSSDSEWAMLNVDGVQVSPSSSRAIFDYDEQTIENVFIPNLGAVEKYGQTVSSEVGKTRLVLKYVTDPKNVIIVGQINSNQIKSGEPFIISDQDDTGLVQSLKSSEDMQRNVTRFISWVLLTIGFGMLIAPILELIEVIPFLGKFAKFIAGVAGAVISAAIVLGGVLLLKYWFVCIPVILIFIGLVIWLLVKLALGSKKNEVEVAADTQTQPETK